jgi:hypothetical protein
MAAVVGATHALSAKAQAFDFEIAYFDKLCRMQSEIVVVKQKPVVKQRDQYW